MLEFLRLFVHVLAAPFPTQAQLEAEITMLRHQPNVLRRQTSKRPRLTTADRGESTAKLPLIERKERLRSLVRCEVHGLRFADHVVGDGPRFRTMPAS